MQRKLDWEQCSMNSLKYLSKVNLITGSFGSGQLGYTGLAYLIKMKSLSCAADLFKWRSWLSTIFPIDICI